MRRDALDMFPTGDDVERAAVQAHCSDLRFRRRVRGQAVCGGLRLAWRTTGSTLIFRVDGAAPGHQVALQLDPAHGLLTGRPGCRVRRTRVFWASQRWTACSLAVTTCWVAHWAVSRSGQEAERVSTGHPFKSPGRILRSYERQMVQ